MPWGVDDVPGVTSSDSATATPEWRARQEQRGRRRYDPQPRHAQPYPAQPPTAPDPADPEVDAQGHRLNVLA